MENSIGGWTYYNEYAMEGNRYVFENGRPLFYPHEMLLISVSAVAIAVNIIMVRPFVFYKQLRVPLYKFLMEWSLINIIYLVYSPGMRRMWMVIFDANQTMYSFLYGLEKGAQLTELLIAIGYLIDAAMGHPLPNCNFLVPLTWLNLVADCTVISGFRKEELFQQLLCEVNLSFYGILVILASAYHTNMKKLGKNKHVHVMMKIITIHLVFWLLYWLLNAAGLFFENTPYHFYLSIMARCIGCCSPVAKMIALVFYDKRYRDFFFQGANPMDVDEPETGKELPSIILKIIETSK